MSRQPPLEPQGLLFVAHCEGQSHEVVLTRRGQLVLVDHPDWKLRLVAVALGDRTCLCLDILRAWRHLCQLPTGVLTPFHGVYGESVSWHYVPMSFHPHLGRARARHLQRQEPATRRAERRTT